MIADKPQNIHVESTVTGDKVAMGIDQTAFVHIMGLLTDVYSDPELAIIREYSTNGRDAHIEAGCPERPIEVTLPGPLAPYLKVRDYGVGLSVEDISDIYSQYGASTKRSTNAQVGMLGIGCKSALTYTNQFTLVAVKDGVRTTAVIERDEEGAGSILIQDASPTEDEPGVEVVVPCRTGNQIERKAREFFRFWEPGTVLVDGQPPKALDGLAITDDITLIEGESNYYRQRSSSYVVMGNVPYPADLDLDMYGHGIVARVPIGAVNIPPARESLHMTDKTKAALELIEATFRANAALAYERVVAEAPSAREALRAKVKWGNALPRAHTAGADLKWNGHDLPTDWRCPSPANEKDTRDHRFFGAPGSASKLSAHSRERAIPASVWGDTIFFYGYDHEKFTPTHKKKINRYIDEHSELSTPRQYVMTKSKPPAEVMRWLDPARVLPWEDVKAVKLPRAARSTVAGPSRLAGSYDLYDAGKPLFEVPADEIDTEREIFYLSGIRNPDLYAKAIFLDYPEAQVVYFSDNRRAKFCRNFESARDGAKEITARFEAWKEGLSEDEKLALSSACYSTNDLSDFDADRVDDPEVKEAIRIANLDGDTLHQRWSVYSNATLAYSRPPRLDVPGIDTRKYPLYDPYSRRADVEHVYLYLNAAYAAFHKEDAHA